MPKILYLSENNQANRIIQKFGNARRLAEAMTRVKRQDDPNATAVDPSAVYKWRMPKSKKGTAGMIPSSAMEIVVKAARLEGIVLSMEDLYPLKEKS